MSTVSIPYRTDLVYALHDAFPVSPGHTLVIPHRHVATDFDATPETYTTHRASETDQASRWSSLSDLAACAS